MWLQPPLNHWTILAREYDWQSFSLKDWLSEKYYIHTHCSIPHLILLCFYENYLFISVDLR